jgi:hypothetical protein
MPRVNAAEQELRVEHALELLCQGHGFTETVCLCAAEWGVGRPAARRYVKQAMGQFREDCAELASTELLAETISRLQRLARRAEEHRQYSAAVGALKTLAELTGLAPDRRS